METEENTISLTLVYQDKHYQIQTRRGQYHTLMTLISDHLSILGFGLCCGMGSCGTCMVKISSKHSSFERFGLSCDVQISDELANTQITIAENIY
jgi:aerobic-type carbon monoxide dehydrogenase small subunit (CoxS/CutS family)